MAKTYQITIQRPRFMFGIMMVLVVCIISFVLMNIYHYNNYSGKYDPIFNQYTVYGKDFDLGTLGIISTHEAAHKFWFKDMTKEQQDKYIKIFNDTNEWVTDYAKNNVSEDFAETVAHNTTCDLDLTSMPNDRRQFFEYLEMPGVIKIISRRN